MQELFMRAALKEAEKAQNEDEVPIGAVIVKDGKIIARAHNRKVKKNCAIHHAEIEAIQKACKKLGTWHLDDCDLYVTLEPCIMCAGAIINSRIRKVCFSTEDPKGGAFGSNMNVLEVKGLNHYPEVEKNVLKDESANILKTFFKAKREKAKNSL